MPDDCGTTLAGAAILHVAIEGNPMAVRAGLLRSLTEGPLSRLSDDERGTAEIVLAEVLNNVVEHAYARWPGRIDLTIRDSAGCVDCRVEDDGLPMPDGMLSADAASCDHDRATASAFADLPEGGFGWSLIRALSLAVDYRRIGNRNRLTIRLPANAPDA